MMRRLSDDVTARLQQMRTQRPRPRSLFELIAAVPFTLITVAVTMNALRTDKGWLATAALVAATIWYWGRWHRWGTWHRAFNGEAQRGGWHRCPLYETPRDTVVDYLARDDHMRVERLGLTLPEPVHVGATHRALFDPAFDAHLGVKASVVSRALLGPTLRARLPTWCTGAQPLVHLDGEAATVRLDAAETLDNQPDLLAAIDALDAYAARLREPPFAALSRMAAEVEHPFDAARALAVLEAQWPALSADLTDTLAETPAGAALVDFVLGGVSITDLTVPWATRSAMARGVLDADCTARRTLLADLPRITPTDMPMAMALAEIAEAAAEATGDLPFPTVPIETALAFVEAEAGPSHLEWLRARAARQTTDRPLLDRVSARLQSERGGLLSVHAGADTGGLSEARSEGS